MSSLSGDRAVFQSRTNPAPYAGRYTMVVPGVDGDVSLPTGDGFGTVQVTPSGLVRLAGTLADGTKVSQAAPVSRQGLWPLYAPLYSGKGSLLSWLAFTNRPKEDLHGPLSWIKPANTNAHHYAGGFTNECNVLGSLYFAPPSRTNLGLNFTNGYVVFSGGDLPADFTNAIALGLGSRVTNLSSNRLALTFSPATGTFTGSTADPNSGILFPFKGALLEKMGLGCGFLLGTNQSSRVIIME